MYVRVECNAWTATAAVRALHMVPQLERGKHKQQQLIACGWPPS